MFIPNQGHAGVSGGCRYATKHLEMEVLFPFAPSSPSYMPPMWYVFTLWDILNSLGISNTFMDVKANILEGPRGCFTILFMPFGQLSHSGLLPINRNTRKTPLWVGNEHKGPASVPAFSSPTPTSKVELLKTEGSEKEEELKTNVRVDISVSPFHLSLRADHEHQEDDKDDQHHSTPCPEEPVYQALLGAELTGFPTVPISVCSQAAEVERRNRWGEGAIQSQGPQNWSWPQEHLMRRWRRDFSGAEQGPLRGWTETNSTFHGWALTRPNIQL